jgi:integrase
MPRDLTAVEVNAKRRKPGAHRVSANLYLLVRPSESGGGLRASWVFRYETSAGGKRVGKHMGLGPATVFTLAEARDLARKQRQLLAEGIDPLQAKRDKKTAAKLEAAKALTFGAAAKQLVDTHRLSWRNAKHAAQWRAVFEGSSRASAATAVINDLPVGSIDTGLALKVLEPIWKKTPETASRVRQRCEAVIDWAKARGYRTGDNPFEWRGHLDSLLPQPKKVRSVKHHPSLPYTEIGALMAALRGNASVSSLALQFTILTACRTNEAINAVWSEINMQERVWTIPGSRMKSGKEHRVPLSDAVVEVLEKLPRETGTAFLFIGSRKGRPLSNMAMLELMRGLRPPYVPHGLRASFRTWCAECTHYPHLVAELALGHTQSDKLMQAYQRGDLISKRTQLMREWAKYCAQLPGQTANVVSLKKGADAS